MPQAVRLSFTRAAGVLIMPADLYLNNGLPVMHDAVII